MSGLWDTTWKRVAIVVAAVIVGAAFVPDGSPAPTAAPDTTTTTVAPTTTTTAPPATTTTAGSSTAGRGCMANGFDLIGIVASEYPDAELFGTTTCEMVWVMLDTATSIVDPDRPGSWPAACEALLVTGATGWHEGMDGFVTYGEAERFVSAVMLGAFYAADFGSPVESLLAVCP